MHPVHRSKRRESGSTLILAIFVVAMLVIFIGLALDYTGNTARVSGRAGDFTRAQALANGALDATYKRWNEYMANNQGGTFSSYTTTASFSPIASSVMTAVNAAAGSTGYTITALSIVPVDRADNPVACQASTYASTGPMTNVPGWVATTYSYRATAVATKTLDPSQTVSISRFFQQADASLFQAMLFFQDDLELHPGPAMTLYGRVHTNGNLYAAAGPSGSLTFQASASNPSNVSYAGNPSTFDPYKNFKFEYLSGYAEGVTQTLYAQEGSGNWGNFNAPVYATSRNSQLTPAIQPLDPLGDSDAVVPGNPNGTGTHEIIERPVPNSATDPNANAAYPDPSQFSAHRIYNSAGLRIFINHNTAYATSAGGSSKIHVYTPDPSNPENSIEVVPTTAPAAPNIANQIVSAITPDASTGDIYDFREGRTINADTVDMSVLTPALNAYSAYNGVVYIADITNADVNGNTGNSDAIRLKKGGVLPDSGLTVATDGAVYVQGDYNTGTTYGPDTGVGNVVTTVTQPTADTNSSSTAYTVTGYTQKPAAVMGDAVMILSNNWSDVNSSLAIGARVATPTSFNAAIVSGAVLTTATNASGGAHNFPRFLENWSSQNFTYHGSMCELYASQHFTGTYGKSNVYSAPNRHWFFDDNFITSPPPGNLRSTNYTRGRWVRNNNS